MQRLSTDHDEEDSIERLYMWETTLRTSLKKCLPQHIDTPPPPTHTHGHFNLKCADINYFHA